MIWHLSIDFDIFNESTRFSRDIKIQSVSKYVGWFFDILNEIKWNQVLQKLYGLMIIWSIGLKLKSPLIRISSGTTKILSTQTENSS